MPVAQICSGFAPRVVPKGRRLGLGGLGLLTLLGWQGGCAPPLVSLTSESEPPGTSYRQALDRWSRHGRILSKTEFDTSLVVVATLRSRAFQRAYVGKYLATYGIADPWEKARIEKEQAEQTEHGLSLFVLTRAHAASWNDLRAQSGKWRVSLLDDQGREVQADRIDAMSSRQAVEQNLLSASGESFDVFTKLWSVHFPASASDGKPFPQPTAHKISLRVAGPLGQTELPWLLQ